MEVLKDRYTITELSEHLSVTDHALRYYEKEFNMSIPKDERGRRYYTPELANVMYQIKHMRDEGFEIKAIKKILQGGNMINDPPPVVVDNTSASIVPIQAQNTSNELKQYFDEFKAQLTSSISNEVNSSKEHLSKELLKTKLELGACVENSMRKLESKMEKHFQDVDRSLGIWRERNQGNFMKKFVKKVFK